MELTLTTRWTEYKSQIQTKELKHGMVVEYYGNDRDYPSQGVIKKRKGVYRIVWDDLSEDTLIDGSTHSLTVLKQCGFEL